MEKKYKGISNEDEKEGENEIKKLREKIVEMVGKIEEEKFLSQIYTILNKHIEKRGG